LGKTILIEFAISLSAALPGQTSAHGCNCIFIKSSNMKHTPKHLLLWLSALLMAIPSLAQDTSQIVISWLKQHSIPVKYIDPGNDFSDLQPLKHVLKDVRIIGLGESTHGTSEFIKIRQRLVEFLVTEMGFTAIAMESSYSDCEPINDYLLTGKGNLPDLLTAQGYTAWDTEEFTAMLYWLRQYNQRVPEEKKVHFYGTDIATTFQETGRVNVISYLKRIAPEKIDSAESIFKVLGNKERSWPRRLDQPALEQIFIPLHELIRYFNANRERMVSASSLKEWRQMLKYLEVMEQGLFGNVKNIPPSLERDKLGRDDYMAQNLLYVMQNEQPNAKFIFWAHNFHVSTYFSERSVGYYLRLRFGEAYYAVGTECNQGTFGARELLPDGRWGLIKADTMLPIQKSVAWHLKQTGIGTLFIDWRSSSSNIVVDKWLDTPSSFCVGNWIYRNTAENVETKKEKNSFDGMVYVELSTPTHLTANALVFTRDRLGF
jgi:erythromycin esterase